MPSPIAPYLDHDTCELRAVGLDIIAYAPTFDACETTITLGTASFVTTDAIVRELGLEPNWG